MTQTERFAEADAIGAYAVANPARVGIHATSPRVIAAVAAVFGMPARPLGSHRAMQSEPADVDFDDEAEAEMLANVDNDTLAQAIEDVLKALKKKRGKFAKTQYENHVDAFMHDVGERAVELMRGAA